MDVDWKLAEAHLRDTAKGLWQTFGTPGVNVMFALTFTIHPLLQRFESGERTDELFQEIMALQ